jgi:hypothetical protein
MEQECNHVWRLYTYKQFQCVKCNKIESFDQHTWIPSEGRYVSKW